MENSRFKLRAWVVNKSVSEMIYPNETDMNSAIAYALWFKLGYQYQEKINIEDWQKEIVFMQYTGLKDKNGKEIYEGDIIHRHMNVYWNVKFINSKWIADEMKPISGLYLDANQFIECEVIGNIYEHSHLLK